MALKALRAAASYVLATVHVLNLFVEAYSHLFLFTAASTVAGSSVGVAGAHEGLHVVLSSSDGVAPCDICVNALAVSWQLSLAAGEVIGEASSLMCLSRLRRGVPLASEQAWSILGSTRAREIVSVRRCLTSVNAWSWPSHRVPSKLSALQVSIQRCVHRRIRDILFLSSSMLATSPLVWWAIVAGLAWLQGI
jgi:hypothetical protein